MMKIIDIKPSQLRNGMIIADEILDRHGRELVKSGTYVDDFMIDRLNTLPISYIKVYYGRPGNSDQSKDEIPPAIMNKILQFRKPDTTKLVLSTLVKERIESGMKSMFQNANNPRIVMREASSIVSDLMESIRKNNSIVLSINDLRISDEYTFRHSVDVAALSMMIGRREGLSSDRIHELGTAGLFHDLGKTRIPNEILNKPGRLTPEEFEIMKKHSEYSYMMIKDNPDISTDIALGVLQHHEKMNGTGYPNGVMGGLIHPYAKILTVADIFDALVTDRPYKKAMKLRDAVEILMTMTAELDENALHSLLHSIILYPEDSVVTLSNGETAKVVRNNPELIQRPTVVSLKNGNVYNLASIDCLNLVIEN